jgi:hypothetical protein
MSAMSAAPPTPAPIPALAAVEIPEEVFAFASAEDVALAMAEGVEDLVEPEIAVEVPITAPIN